MQQLLPGYCFIYSISGQRAAGPGKGPHHAGFGSASTENSQPVGQGRERCRFSYKLMI